MIEDKDIAMLFEDLLARIGDEGLRRQVVEAWVLGCEEGGWTDVEELKAMPFTLLTATHGIDFISHTRAVTAGALGLARAILDNSPAIPFRIDLDLLIAGGLLHDVGKLTEFERGEDGEYRKSHAGRCLRHPISGTVLAARVGVPQEVLNMIACHSREGDGRPKRVETVLIHQADFATFDPLVMLNGGTLIR